MFENIFDITEDKYIYTVTNSVIDRVKKEAKRAKRISLLSGILSIIMFFIAAVVQSWLYAGTFLLIAIMSVYGYTYRREARYRKLYKKTVATMKEQKWIRKTEFNAAISISENGANIKIPYAKITDVTEDEFFYYLFRGVNDVIYIDKQGFNKGNAEEFLPFILEKIGKN